ncbi:MAG: isopentenyl-diphosphate Delta-isomerase [Brevirhabdus sp.]
MSDLIPAWEQGTLKPIDKLRVHRDGLRHKAVSVFVMDGTRVLIQQRAMSKYHTPGLWANTCCTHPNWGESPIDCAVRRLDDELGIKGLYPVYRDTVEYCADVGNGMIENEIVDVFLAEATQTLPVDMNPVEVMAVRWVDFYELSADVARHPERYTPWLKIYLQDHSNRIFGTLVNS